MSWVERLATLGRPDWLWLESILIALLAVWIGWMASPDDPLFVSGAFPWSWFAPVLVALRYGVPPAVLSSAILLAAYYAFAPLGLAAPVPRVFVLGGMLLVMICGEYSGIWRTRVRRQNERNAYLEDRVERITKRLYLLRLSHDRLEQDLLSRPATLRDALADLRRRIDVSDRSALLPAAQETLVFLAQYCQLDVAALHAISGAGVFQQVAGIGDPPPLRADDPLLTYACDELKLAHVQSDAIDRLAPTDHLVVAPIVTSDWRLLGVVTITRMPFLAMTEDTLQMLSVLCAAYADSITGSEKVRPLIAAYPACPAYFAEEMLKLARLHRDFNLHSHIVVLDMGDHPQRLDLFHLLLRQRRTPDVIWHTENPAPGRHSFIVTMMPLARRNTVDGYLVRAENSLKEQLGGDFDTHKVRAQVIALDNADPLGALKNLIEGSAL